MIDVEEIMHPILCCGRDRKMTHNFLLKMKLNHEKTEMLHGNCFQEDLTSSFSKKNQKDFSWYRSVKTCYRTLNKLDFKKKNSKKMPFLQKTSFIS